MSLKLAVLGIVMAVSGCTPAVVPSSQEQPTTVAPVTAAATPPTGTSSGERPPLAAASLSSEEPTPAPKDRSSESFIFQRQEFSDTNANPTSLFAIDAAAVSCKVRGAPTGEGHISITFSHDGIVVSAVVDRPPFAGTAVGRCIERRFRGARIAAYSGQSFTIERRFRIAD